MAFLAVKEIAGEKKTREYLAPHSGFSLYRPSKEDVLLGPGRRAPGGERRRRRMTGPMLDCCSAVGMGGRRVYQARNAMIPGYMDRYMVRLSLRSARKPTTRTYFAHASGMRVLVSGVLGRLDESSADKMGCVVWGAYSMLCSRDGLHTRCASLESCAHGIKATASSFGRCREELQGGSDDGFKSHPHVPPSTKHCIAPPSFLITHVSRYILDNPGHAAIHRGLLSMWSGSRTSLDTTSRGFTATSPFSPFSVVAESLDPIGEFFSPDVPSSTGRLRYNSALLITGFVLGGLLVNGHTESNQFLSSPFFAHRSFL